MQKESATTKHKNSFKQQKQSGKRNCTPKTHSLVRRPEIEKMFPGTFFYEKQNKLQYNELHYTF